MNNVYLFLGNESLIIHNKIEKFIADNDLHEYSRESFDMEETPLAEAISAARHASLLDPGRIVIIRNPVFLTKAKSLINHNVAVLDAYLDSPHEGTILIIRADGLELNQSQPIVKKLLQTAVVNETKDLSAVEAEGWLKRQFSLAGCEITPDAARHFFARAGYNLLNARNEIDKLLIYVGDRRHVTKEDVELLVTRELETEIYELTNAIIAHNEEATLAIYRDLLAGDQAASRILALVSRSLGDILLAKQMLLMKMNQNQIAAAFGFSRRRTYYLMRNAEAFTLAEIEAQVRKLAAIDYKVKTGFMDAGVGMEIFLFGLAQ